MHILRLHAVTKIPNKLYVITPKLYVNTVETGIQQLKNYISAFVGTTTTS